MLADESLLPYLQALTPEELEAVIATLPEAAVNSLLDGGQMASTEKPTKYLINHAKKVQEDFRVRKHLSYLGKRLTQALRDVENGKNRRIIVEMPPRSGKTTLATTHFASWCLAQHPDWPLALVSHDGRLATSWGRQIRRWAERGFLGKDVEVAKDAGAAGEWETTSGGKMLSVSVRESFTGRGAKVLVVDDPHKDFVDAHSKTMRDNIWEWWKAVGLTRLHAPFLVVVIMTRWHEDDLVGRLLSDDYEGDSSAWEVIRIPAIAEKGDLLKREVGEPLLSPLVEENFEQAKERWEDVRNSVGSYTWSAMYQQRPAPAKGAIFDMEKIRFWTTNSANVTDDGKCVFLDPATLSAGKWVDSWDMAFKGTESSDFVVGQRWCRLGPNRYLIAQQRGRWKFTEALASVLRWIAPGPGEERAEGYDPDLNPFGDLVHLRLVESAANGEAILSTLEDSVAGLKAVKATVSKESRARAVTPEVESGHIYLPHPSDPGNGWVSDLLSELREFPYGANDDQVDAFTQALNELRTPTGVGGVVNPGANRRADWNVAETSRTSMRGGRGAGPMARRRL